MKPILSNTLLRFVCFVYLVFFVYYISAQNVAPVSSFSSISSPFPRSISDFTRNGNDMVELRLRLLDASVGSAKIKLRMVLFSDKLRIENKYPLPISFNIFSGEFLSLNADDLSSYFDLSQISFSGISRNEYLKNGGKLPDGSYRLLFEVFEYSTGRKVSMNESPAFFNLISCDPPILNTPTNNSVILKDNSSIVFSWTPRHLSYAGLLTSNYSFELARVPQNFSGDIKKQFTVLPVIYTLNTSVPSFVYDINLPSLEVGYRYAFRVKASAILYSGGDLVFNNDGYSEVYTFSYNEFCPPISQWYIDSVGMYSALIRWGSDPIDKGYTISYRKADIADAQWFSIELGDDISEYSLYPLKPSTIYECKLNRNCSFSNSENDFIKRFATLSEENSLLDCGKHPQSGGTIKEDPLPILRMFDQVKTQMGFVLSIDEVSGENGVFSGTAHTYIPLLGNTGVKLKFSKIFVNKNYEIVSGVFKAVVSRRNL